MKVYILEDEINILKYMLSLVNDIPYLQVVGYAADIVKATQEIPELQPELILADIQLKDGNSFTLFKSIQTDAPIIFITAYNQYAIEALNLGAFAYLLKPVDAVLFNETVARCYQKAEAFKFNRHQLEIADRHFNNKEEQPQRIALKNSDFMQIISVKDILYCQSEKGYTTFFLNDGSKILVSKVLKEYENLLPANIFIRCHQSFLVNINNIRKFYKEGEIELSNGDRIPVSDRKKNAIMEYIERLL